MPDKLDVKEGSLSDPSCYGNGNQPGHHGVIGTVHLKG